MASYISTSTSPFVGYSSGTYVPYPPPETKEDKVNKLLEKVDAEDRLKAILKKVKGGKLTYEDAIKAIQEDKQFAKPLPQENNWHQWESTSGTMIIGGANGCLTTTTAYPYLGNSITYTT